MLHITAQGLDDRLVGQGLQLVLLARNGHRSAAAHFLQKRRCQRRFSRAAVAANQDQSGAFGGAALRGSARHDAQPCQIGFAPEQPLGEGKIRLKVGKSQREFP